MMGVISGSPNHQSEAILHNSSAAVLSLAITLKSYGRLVLQSTFWSTNGSFVMLDKRVHLVYQKVNYGTA